MVDVPIKPEQGKLKRIIKPLFLIILAHVIVIYMCMYLYTHIYTQSGFGVPCLAIGIAVSSSSLISQSI